MLIYLIFGIQYALFNLLTTMTYALIYKQEQVNNYLQFSDKVNKWEYMIHQQYDNVNNAVFYNSNRLHHHLMHQILKLDAHQVLKQAIGFLEYRL